MLNTGKGRMKRDQAFDYFCNWSGEGIDKMLTMLMHDLASADGQNNIGDIPIRDENMEQLLEDIRDSCMMGQLCSSVGASTLRQVEFFKRVAVSEYIGSFLENFDSSLVETATNSKELGLLSNPDEIFQLTEEDFVKRFDITKNAFNMIPFPEKYITNLKDACCRAAETNPEEEIEKDYENELIPIARLALSKKEQSLRTVESLLEELENKQLRRGFKYYSTSGIKKPFQLYKNREEFTSEYVEFFLRLSFDKIITKMEISKIRDFITSNNSSNMNDIEVHRLGFDRFYELARDPKNTVEILKKEGKTVNEAFLTFLNNQYVLCKKHSLNFSVDCTRTLNTYFRENIVPAVYDNYTDWFIETVLLIKGIILLNEEVELENKLSWYEYIFVEQRSYQLAAMKYKLLCDGKDEAPNCFTDAIDTIIDRYVKENTKDDSMIRSKLVKGDPIVHQFIREVDRDILKLGATAKEYRFNEENLRLRQFPKEILFLRKIKGLEQFRIAKLKGSKCNINKPNIRKKVNREMKSFYASVRDSFNALSNKEFEAPQHYLDAVDMLSDQCITIFSKIHHNKLQLYLAHLITNLEMVSIQYIFEEKNSRFSILQEVLLNAEYCDGRLVTRHCILHPVWITELAKNIGIIDKNGNKIQLPDFEREVNIERMAFNMIEYLSTFEMFPSKVNTLSDSDHCESEIESDGSDCYDENGCASFKLNEERLKQLGVMNEMLSRKVNEDKSGSSENSSDDNQTSNGSSPKPTTSKEGYDGNHIDNDKHNTDLVNDRTSIFEKQLQKACRDVDKNSLKELLQICKKGSETKELSMQDVSCIDKIMGQIVMNFISQTEECDNISDEVLKQKIAHLANLFEKDPTELNNISDLAFGRAKQVKDEHEFRMKMKLSSRKSYTCNRAAYIENYIRGQLGFHSSGKGEKSSTLQNSTPSFSESFNLLKNQNQSSNTSSSEELSTSSSLLPTTSSNIAQDCKMNGNKTIVEQQTPTFQGCKPSTSKELPSSSFIEDITSNKNNISYLLQKCVKNRRLPKNEQREFYCLPLIDRTPQIINQTMGPCPEISKYKTAALLFTENVMSKEKEIVIKNDRALISKLEEVYKPKDKGIPEKYKEEVERIFALTEQKKVFDHLNSFN